MVTEHPNLAAALVAALTDLTVVEKGRTAKIPTKTGRDYSYEYADIADVVKLTRPVLASHGLAALTPVHEHGNGLACTVIIVHASGERLDLGPFPFPHGKDAQATGSMVTYHRRYALVAALGMAAGDDDDGASAAPNPTQGPADPRISKGNADALRQKCKDRELDVAKVVKLGTDGRTEDPGEVHKDEVAAVKKAMDDLEAQANAMADAVSPGGHDGGTPADPALDDRRAAWDAQHPDEPF